jgi:hypothetical protein
MMSSRVAVFMLVFQGGLAAGARPGAQWPRGRDSTRFDVGGLGYRDATLGVAGSPTRLRT